MTAVNSNDQVKAAVFQLVEKMIISKDSYESLIQNIDHKLTEKAPKAAKPELQNAIEKVHQAYKETIRKSRENLRSQYELGSSLFVCLEDLFKTSNPDLSKLNSHLETFQAKLVPLLQDLEKLQEEEATQEAQIISLMNKNTVLVTL